MPQISILFFGCSANSAIVKQALIKAGYQFTADQKQADLIVSADYGQKLPAGGLNLHPSLLPKYRGPTPVPNAILNNNKETGISIIKMTDQFDAGPIMAQEKVLIMPDDTTPVLLKRCFTTGAKLLVKILPAYLNTKITLKLQDESQATYTHKFTKADGFISWKEFEKTINLSFGSLDFELARKVRALFPWPGVWSKMPGNKILKLLPQNLIQLEGKNPITMKQFLAGYRHLL